jgi:hypothetical protein
MIQHKRIAVKRVHQVIERNQVPSCRKESLNFPYHGITMPTVNIALAALKNFYG